MDRSVVLSTLAALLLASGIAVAAPGKAALVATGAPPPTAERLVSVAAELAERGLVLADLDEPTRRVLISTEREPTADEEVARHLQRARERLRRFQLDAAAAALDDAWREIERLPPTGESRTLAVEVAVRDADLALVRRDERAARAAVSLALSASPRLALDPRKERPELVSFVEARRSAAVSERAVEVRSTPPGAAIVVGDRVVGTTPATVRVPTDPQLVWIAADGFAPRAVRLLDGKSTVDVALERQPFAARTRPLVDAVRRSTGAVQEAAAVALGRALGVDAVVLVNGAEPKPIVVLVDRARPAAAPPAIAVTAPPPSRPAPSRRRVTLGIALGVVGALAVGAAVGLGVAFAPRTTYDVACCR